MARPVTAPELQRILEETGLYPWHAAANGREIYEGLVLERQGAVWLVFNTGLGAIPEMERFATEAEAVYRFVERLAASLPMEARVMQRLRG